MRMTSSLRVVPFAASSSSVIALSASTAFARDECLDRLINHSIAPSNAFETEKPEVAATEFVVITAI